MLLHLKAPPWSNPSPPSPSPSPSPLSASAPTPTLVPPPSSSSSSTEVVGEEHEALARLVASLNDRRLYREVALSLSTALQDVGSDFSFLRLKGLKSLIKLLSSLSRSETLNRLFQESQEVSTLQVVPVLFEHILTPVRSHNTIPSVIASYEEPLQIVSPPTDYEVVLALRVLEGCCLLHEGSRVVAFQYKAIKEVIELLSAGGVLEQGACLDVLPALMLNTPVNQKEFLTHDGIKRISELVKHDHVDETMRLKCAELLLLLVSLLPKECNENNGSVTAEGAVLELHKLLGDAFISVLREEQVVGSFPDWQENGGTLGAKAKQLLDLLDSSSW